jgi:hypothetical protein
MFADANLLPAPLRSVTRVCLIMVASFLGTSAAIALWDSVYFKALVISWTHLKVLCEHILRTF